MPNLVNMRFLTLPLFIFFSLVSKAQCVTFKLTSKRDTINCTDKNGLKQGRWKVEMPPLRGERGYEEEGVFMNGKKEGTWRKFNLMGDLLAVENYKWGLKDGMCRYYTIAGLEREEGWRAVNPAKQFDTVEVQDVIDPNKNETVIIKTNGNSLKHGRWRFYYPMTGELIKTENWFLDQIVEPGKEPGNPEKGAKNADSASVKKDTSSVKSKPKEVLEFEKKNSGKKKVQIRDGKTGG